MSEMNIPFSPPDIGEEEITEVIKVLKSGWITTGVVTKEFENELANFTGNNKMVCLNSATAALELTLKILGIGPGDEVIVPAYTYTASCSVICHVGATPILVDVAKDSFEMDYDMLTTLVNEKTKAIIAVDIAGIICDYDKLRTVLNSVKHKHSPTDNEIQKKFDRVVIISDAAHALGAQKNGMNCGQLADFTCYSFHAVKNLTTAEGGAVTWLPISDIEDNWIYQQYQLFSLHGQTKSALDKSSLGSWEYDIVYPAYKCNMTNVLAAVGRAQLSRYPQMLDRRHEIIQKYDSAFESYNVKLLDHEGINHRSSGHLYFVRINNITEEQRNEIIIKMAERGIACNVHYKPLPMLTAYKNLGFDIKDYPNAYKQYQNEITLPLFSTLKDEEVEYIIRNFVSLIGEI